MLVQPERGSIRRQFIVSKPLVALAALGVALLLQANSASAAQFQVGAQVCQYMSLDQAKTLQFRSNGILNTNNKEQWVVCPIATQPFGDNVDIIARISNRSDAGATVQCPYKLTDEVGNTVRTVSQSAPVPQGFSVALATANIDFRPDVVLSISCKLPSQFLLVSFSIETQ